MSYCSFDPYKLELHSEYAIDDTLDPSLINNGFLAWSNLPLTHRISCFNELALLLEQQTEKLARLSVLEVGKPISEARVEIQKCYATIRYYCSVAPELLKEKVIVSEALYSAVRPEPLGPILAVMPWNFPFWQVFRFAVPAMLAGNTVLLKHAPNVPQCAMAIADLFVAAGFPENTLINYFLSNEAVAQFIAHPVVAGVTFTGSDASGSIIGQLAGKYCKKSTLELGGNDPMVIFSDADMEACVNAALFSRCINAGQACNGAKRFLVEQKVHDEFVARLRQAVHQLRVGDPSDENTQIGPLARLGLLQKVKLQVNSSVEQGARVEAVVATPNDTGWFYPPTVLSKVLPGMTVFEEEVFGPVWSITSFTSKEQAVELANNSIYGLGAAVWTTNEELISWIIPRLQTGNVFINDFVRSDPRFPFGGVKRSGHGKELGEAGLYEFINWKTVFRNK
jgi:succinate-semialdehyde dehydrogenase/glutarate-semialdehyde dehydrogenase